MGLQCCTFGRFIIFYSVQVCQWTRLSRQLCTCDCSICFYGCDYRHKVLLWHCKMSPREVSVTLQNDTCPSQHTWVLQKVLHKVDQRIVSGCDAAHSTFLIDVQELSGKREDLTDFIIEKNTLKRNNFYDSSPIFDVIALVIGTTHGTLQCNDYCIRNVLSCLMQHVHACSSLEQVLSINPPTYFHSQKPALGDAGTWMSNNHPMFSFKN